MLGERIDEFDPVPIEIVSYLVGKRMPPQPSQETRPPTGEKRERNGSIGRRPTRRHEYVVRRSLRILLGIRRHEIPKIQRRDPHKQPNTRSHPCLLTSRSAMCRLGSGIRR